MQGGHRTPFKEREILSDSCLGKRLQDVATISKLFCRYHSTNAFTKIAPFKLEVMNLHPFVAIFHEIISEEEINIFKMMTMPKLKRAQVMTMGKNVVSKNRVAKLGFIYERDDKTGALERVGNRVSDMTGLNLETGQNCLFSLEK